MITVCPAYLHWGDIQRTVIIGGLPSARGKICPQGGGGFIRTSLNEPEKQIIFVIIDKNEAIKWQV